jgi:hypothetical protein
MGGPPDVPAHQLLQLVLGLGLDEPNDLVVIPPGLIQVLLDGQGPEAHDLLAEVVEDLDQAAAAADPVEGVVEEGVEPPQLLDLGRGLHLGVIQDPVGPLGDAPELGQVARSGVVAGQPPGVDLQDLADPGDVDDALGRHGRDLDPALGDADRQALLLQPEEGLPDGCPADLEQLGHLVLHQPLAGLDVAEEDPLLEELVDLVGDGLGGIHHDLPAPVLETHGQPPDQWLDL